MPKTTRPRQMPAQPTAEVIGEIDPKLAASTPPRLLLAMRLLQVVGYRLSYDPPLSSSPNPSLLNGTFVLESGDGRDIRTCPSAELPRLAQRLVEGEDRPWHAQGAQSFK